MDYFPSRWAPLPDPDKPNCPYLPGFKVQLASHTPPPPFGGREYPSGEQTEVTDEWLQRVTQSENVLTHPPRETPSPSLPEAAEITITKTIVIGNARGAQLVVCTVVPQDNREPFLAVAKIFDALYYPYSDNIAGNPNDVVGMADMDYSREAAAYEHLVIVGNTSFTPEYFGSWTFNLPINRAGVTQQRPVRLVLIEYLDGPSMKDLYARNTSGPTAELDAFHYEEEYRLEILAQILDGEVKQEHGGLSHRDVAPRNLIIVPRPQADYGSAKPPRVVLIDYNISYVWEKTKRGRLPIHDLIRPRNPIEYFWTSSLAELTGWIPDEWHRYPNLRQEWLMRQFDGDKELLYAPLTRKLRLYGSPEEPEASKEASPPAAGEEYASRSTSSQIIPVQKPRRPYVPKEVAPPPIMLPGDRYSTWPIQLFSPEVLKSIEEKYPVHE